MARLYTIGHSNRSFDDFVSILLGAGVGIVADIRKLPGSRSNPAYDGNALAARLTDRRIDYRHLPALGGRRGRQPDASGGTNAAWRNRSFRNYADYALTDDFAAGLDELIALAEARPTAMMCAEAVWWRCHRRIVADHLLFRGHEVVHLMGEARAEPARPSPAARPTAAGRVVYPGDPDA
jgi:uncharacterized protein (DUF488 family)